MMLPTWSKTALYPPFGQGFDAHPSGHSREQSQSKRYNDFMGEPSFLRVPTILPTRRQRATSLFLFLKEKVILHYKR